MLALKAQFGWGFEFRYFPLPNQRFSTSSGSKFMLVGGININAARFSIHINGGRWEGEGGGAYQYYLILTELTKNDYLLMVITCGSAAFHLIITSPIHQLYEKAHMTKIKLKLFDLPFFSRCIMYFSSIFSN